MLGVWVGAWGGVDQDHITNFSWGCELYNKGIWSSTEIDGLGCLAATLIIHHHENLAVDGEQIKNGTFMSTA